MRVVQLLAIILILVLAVCLQSVGSQEIIRDSAHKADTVIFVPQMELRPAGDVTNAVNLEKHLIQSPSGALFKSMLVPGLGQTGNKRWFKAGLFATLETWFAVNAIKYGQEAHSIKAQFDAETNLDTRRSIHLRYDNRRIERNKYVWFFGLTTFVSMFDAYVDAHLSGSPSNKRNDQFTVDFVPDHRGGGWAQLALRF